MKKSEGIGRTEADRKEGEITGTKVIHSCRIGGLRKKGDRSGGKTSKVGNSEMGITLFGVRKRGKTPPSGDGEGDKKKIVGVGEKRTNQQDCPGR